MSVWIRLDFRDVFKKSSICKNFLGYSEELASLIGIAMAMESKFIQWQPHPVTGHSVCPLNHSTIWLEWPPCRQDWHQVNQLLNGFTLRMFSGFSAFGSRFACFCERDEGVPMWTRQRAHLGRGLRQPGHAIIFVLFDGLEYWANLLGLDPVDSTLVSMELPQKLHVTNTCWGGFWLGSFKLRWISNSDQFSG